MQKLVPLSVVIGAVAVVLGSCDSPAVAGSFATNTYINGHERGTRTVEAVNVSKVNGQQINRSEALKFETNFPTASGGVYFDGKGLTGGLDVSTRQIDPFVKGAYSNQVERLSFSDYTRADISEKVTFSNDIYTQTIEAGSN